MDIEFCPVLSQMLADDQTIGRTGRKFQQLGANSTPNNLRYIQRIMRERKPQQTLEIGLAFGASALVFCSEHSGQHTAIDPFQESVWDAAGVLAIERAGLAGFLDYHNDFSEFVLPRLCEQGRKYDFIYVDGSHLFENVFIDAFYCVMLLNGGGLIAFDDCTDPHVAKVMAFIRTNMTASLREIMPDNFRQRIARLLGKRQLIAFERIGPPRREWDTKFRAF